VKIPHRILMGTDFSDYSKEALDYAVLMAKHFGAELYLLHVLDVPTYIPGSPASPGRIFLS
jgi:nucleotide-binding universal stress UspA family protein